jgi:predicted nucleic acid-binding protein
MMTVRVFLDTNVLVYLFDRDAPAKQQRARELLEQGAAENRLVVSTQVLQEFYVTVRRKLAEPLEPEAAYLALRDLAALPLVQVDGQHVLTAARMCEQDGISFWDALIVQAAISGGAGLLYTEDMQHGRRFGELRVHDPFR